jgi:hypothetical protein
MRAAAHRLSRAIRRAGRIRPMLAIAVSLGVAATAAHGAAAPEAAPKAQAAPAPAGALGQHLDYIRVHEVPADLLSAKPADGPLVVDLRFATVGSNDGFSLSDWLSTRARPASPVLVLFNDATQPAITDALAPGYLPGSVITLGPAGSRLAPDIAVAVDAAADRRAYNAFESGAALNSLVEPVTNKQRFDEAELIRRESADNSAKAAPPAPAPGRNGGRGRGPNREPAVVDLVLQRAVQLHRSLVALGRIK